MSDPSKNATTDAAVQPWHAAYPDPKSTVPSVSRAEVLNWLRDGRQSGKDFVLVDVRRTDHELAAASASETPENPIYSRDYTLWLVFGSCGGRGPRAAAWFADYLERQNDTTLQSLVLEGGIKGWAASGTEYTEWMDEYDASVWAKN
ncbi:hypothetical protein N7478_013332 [Penicillium angulare]|uniref:uncharacterized protein n=1 Tax=Penicillium angulare TaxID=116970 RepID=UPI002540617D|nr:uncharacterized protein N7478_013332 [Penicillium angulare]KAJ5257228.1 hypothetical protein N7478_013332 [Penicillium angulare]